MMAQLKTGLQVTLLTGLLMSMPTLATAQDARFAMEKTEDGYVRMDMRTGAMSLCSVQGDQIVCKMAADERSAFDADLKELENRIVALENQLKSGVPLMSNNGLPTEEEFERGLGYMEKFMRRFMGIAKELDGQTDRT